MVYWSNDGTIIGPISQGSPTTPVQAVTLTVTNGLYSVRLGDTATTGMTAIPSAVFANPDVWLRLWFSDGTQAHGFQQLSPDQRISAVGYAVMAENSAQLGGYSIGNLPFSVPVGGVIMWWGAVDQIPPGFELCDGNAPTTLGATLGGLKPNLLDRFPKGALAGATNAQTANVSGGQNDDPPE